jgi:transcriptional regulator with XRE-family HTH domain
METLQSTRQLHVWTEPHTLEQAKSEFSDFHAYFQSIAAHRVGRDLPRESVLLLYMHEDASKDLWKKIFELCQQKHPEATLFYSPHHSSGWAFHLGRIAEKYHLRNAVWASSFHHLKQLLRANNVPQIVNTAKVKFDIVGARNRLGLTQTELAATLGIATRTLQNWESGVGLSQMAKKVRDLSDLLGMMDEFVMAPKEAQWLKTPLEAFANRAPIDLIKEGKLRDLVIEFHRLREGQPI